MAMVQSTRWIASAAVEAESRDSVVSLWLLIRSSSSSFLFLYFLLNGADSARRVDSQYDTASIVTRQKGEKVEVEGRERRRKKKNSRTISV